MNKRFAYLIIASMVLGVTVGWACNQFLDPAQTEEAVKWFKMGTDLFLRLIKMIIAPLVLSTLVVGITHMGGTGALGRIGLRAVAWFVGASLLSLSLGLVLFHVTASLGEVLGLTPHLVVPPVTEGTGLDKAGFDLAKFITHVVPSSIFDAMATNEILQIVVFSVFLGVAISAVGEKAAPLVRATEALVAVMLQVTNYVMMFAPLAVFAAVSATLTEQGPGVIKNLAYFMGSFYFGLAVLWALLFGLCYLIVGPRTRSLLRYIGAPLMIGFSTASSEAAYPRILDSLPKVGVRRRIVSFVLPLGYSFNLDGSMLYCTFATMFILQAHGVHLSVQQQIFMLLLLMVTSKGIAGVPRASLVVIMATLTYFGLPETWIALVLGVDHLLDMGRSATNVVGNSVAAAVVAKWEGELDDIVEEEAPARA